MNKYRIDYTIIGVSSYTDIIEAESFTMAYHKTLLHVNVIADGEKYEIESISLIAE